MPKIGNFFDLFRLNGQLVDEIVSIHRVLQNCQNSFWPVTVCQKYYKKNDFLHFREDHILKSSTCYCKIKDFSRMNRDLNHNRQFSLAVTFFLVNSTTQRQIKFNGKVWKLNRTEAEFGRYRYKKILNFFALRMHGMHNISYNNMEVYNS